MTYQEFIEECKQKTYNELTECHHIIPRCMGGTEAEENQVKLSLGDHWEAHRLLAEENPDDKKLVYIFTRMGTKESFIQKEINFLTKCAYRNKGKNHPNYGRHLSESCKANLSKSMTGKAKGKSWFNNGIIATMAYECPEGFVPGYLKKQLTS